MKIKHQLTKQEFAVMMSVVNTKTLPILGNIMVERGKVFATDLNVAVYKSVQSDTVGVIPKGLPYEVATVQSADPTDFPELPTPTAPTDTFALTDTAVRRLARLAKLASKDTTRPALTGVAFLNHDDTPYAVATDGYVLGVEPLDTLTASPTAPIVATPTPIIPARVFALLKKLKGEWTARFYEDIATFEHEGGVVLQTALISTPYPDVNTLLDRMRASLSPFTHEVGIDSPLLPYIKSSKPAKGYGEEQVAVFTADSCQVKLPDLTPTAVATTATPTYNSLNWHEPFQIIMPLTGFPKDEVALDMSLLKRLDNPKGFTLAFTGNSTDPVIVRGRTM